MQAAPDLALAALRAELDAIDDELHALLIRRAAVIERVARDGGKTGPKIRPGREAAMLRRRLGRHQGALPAQTIVRFWRELFAGALVIEGGQVIAVADDGDRERLALAREHFGPLTPMRRMKNVGEALEDVAAGRAQVAVLPPLEAGWWASLPPGLCVIGKLPFFTAKLPGTAVGEAFLVACMEPDPSGADIGLLAIPGAQAPGFPVRKLYPAVGGQALAEVDGLVAADDARLALSGIRSLGGYAAPLAKP